MNMVNTTYISTNYITNKLQEKKDKTKSKLHKNISNQKCEYIVNKQKHQIDKKKYVSNSIFFSTRLQSANKQIGEIWMNMVNTTYISTNYITNKLQEKKDKTKSKLHKNISNQ